MLPSTHFKLLSFALLISCLFPAIISASQQAYTETRTKLTYPITTASPHYTIELNYTRAFDVKIKSYNGNEGQTGFCHVMPSKISYRLTWSAQIYNDSADESILHYYDNIGIYQKYYLLLDSVTFNITAAKDLMHNDTYVTIESDFANDIEDDRPEDTYMVVATELDLLLIVTRKKLYYYNLDSFFNAVAQNHPIPHIQDRFENYRQYSNLVAVEYSNHRLYIVADNIVDVFKVTSSGTFYKEIQFNAEYFGTNNVFLTGVAFKGNYVFVLDKFKGVYLVDLSNVNKTFESLRSRYWFQIDATLEVNNGQLINIVGNTLHIITAGSKTPALREYAIIGESVFSRYELVRQTELYQSIRDTYSDSNFLFLVTGYFNVVRKFGVPARYNDPLTLDFMDDYWPMFGTKDMITIPSDLYSRVVALHDNKVTSFKVYERNPILTCNMKQATEGLHRYYIEGVQKNCPAKASDRTSDHNSVCLFYQEYELNVLGGGTNIGDVSTVKTTVLILVVSIILMLLLVILFIYLFRKYRSQYQKLEEEIKFQKLEEEAEEQESGQEGASKGKKKQVRGELSPDNVQVELGARK